MAPKHRPDGARGGGAARRIAARALAIALLGVCIGAAVAFGAFSRTTSNAGNTVTAATLQPATGLSAPTSCTQTATITRVAAASATGAGTVTVNKPTGTAAGHVLMAGIAMRGGSGVTITPPTGWTLVRRDSDAGGSVTSAVYWKLAGGSEPASYAFATSAARTVGGVIAYSGVNTGAPVHTSGAASGASNPANAPSITTTIANTELIAFGAVRQQTFGAAPAGMTSQWSLNTGGGAGANVGGTAADQAFAGPGATGAKGFTVTAGFDWVLQSIALRPPRDPRVSLSWTASSSAFATGYTLERWIGGTLNATFTIGSASTTTYVDDTTTDGTAYTYRLYARYSGWRSTAASVSATAPSC